MATLEQLQARLDALEEVKASGTLKVRYEGKEIEYRSMADLQTAIRDLKADIAAASGRRKANVGLVHFTRG
ncbi:phage head-tail joining protein [Leisingera daeponensis]|uniref:phage head-tail joining protein n=1 Tax=Leisingera daeponensis TaxID=405746 RepID=UPI001C97D239|nr:hypothetical protein [Leisingera daeponensis]MBY6055390.1 hypothetical protein [Leisingera daeponensis]